MSDETLIETSFAAAIATISRSEELPEQTRRHWTCSMRGIAKGLGRPEETIPARYSAIRTALRQLHHAPLGLTAKRLMNHKANTKAALRWLNREKNVPEYGARLAPEWEELRTHVEDNVGRSRLSPLMRFCSVKGIAPDEVDESVVDRFIEYRARSTARPVNAAARRLLAKAWNANVGIIEKWPKHRLIEPPGQTSGKPEWSEFPEGLRKDVERYLQGLKQLRRSRGGQRIRPLKSSTIKNRRNELTIAARTAVRLGVPIESLTSLGALLAPEVARKILDAFWEKNGETPKTFTIDLGMRFLSIARETGCVDGAECEELAEIWAALGAHRRTGLSDKNLDLIRKVQTDGVWDRVVNLAPKLMTMARSQFDHAPNRAAVTAQIAVAIAILTVAPVRLINLTSIRLDHNLIKPGGPDSNYWLVFPHYDVKNRIKLEYPLSSDITQLIDEYVHMMRPALMRGRNEDWLFPGQRGGAKQKVAFSGQITQRIQKATGLRITVHQFRHAAGAIILKHRPGDYQLVRLLLGHRSIETTLKSYVGLESIQASEVFGQIIRDKLQLAEEELP
jgi:integrase